MAKVPCRGVPSSCQPPVDRGKNSYQEPNSARRRSASLIWDSPFGPLRGDVAHVLNKATDDRTQVFQFTIGQTF